MDGNGQTIGTELVFTVAGLLIFGIVFNYFVVEFQKKTVKYTAELVVLGVLFTIVVSGFVIGWENASKLVLLFTASGLPMLIGSWMRTAHDEEEARREFQSLIKKEKPRDIPK